jgi:hypothetical protein
MSKKDVKNIEEIDTEYKKSSKYKYFKEEIKYSLQQFESLKEFSDIISIFFNNF